MIVTRQRVTLEEGFVEFSTLEKAQEYCVANEISEDQIEEIEKDIPGTTMVEIDGKSVLSKKIVPLMISARQIRLALLQVGVSMADVDTGLNSLEEPIKSQALIEWQYSTRFSRDNMLADVVANLLGWDSDQVDDLWILAATL